jgi:hypothetical protein
MAPENTKVITQIIKDRKHNKTKNEKRKIVDMLFTERQQNVFTFINISNLYK